MTVKRWSTGPDKSFIVIVDLEDRPVTRTWNPPSPMSAEQRESLEDREAAQRTRFEKAVFE